MIPRFATLVVLLSLVAALGACASSESGAESGADSSALTARSGSSGDAEVRWFYVSTVTDPPFSPQPAGALRRSRAEAEKDVAAYLDRHPYHRGDVYIRAIDVTTGAILLNSLPWNEGESDAHLANKP